MIPSSLVSKGKNPPIPLSVTGVSIDERPIFDGDPRTYSVIDPYELSLRDMVLVFDLGKVYPVGSLTSEIRYHSSAPVDISISKDGKTYISTTLWSLTSFEFRYVRITFPKQIKTTTIPTIHTVLFFETDEASFFVKSPGTTLITAYRWFGCDTSMWSTLSASKPNLDTIEVSPTLPIIRTSFQSNPLYKNDLDHDGVDTLIDNCPTIANADQLDRNTDGVGDVCSDDDRDGISGTSDNCPTIANADQKDVNVNRVGDACEFDSDQDGIADGIDMCIHTKNPDQADTDYDRIGNACDNCQLYNPDQLDLDKNGIGDACDRNREFEKTHDEDNDGILDSQDNCQKISNLDQKDTDQDGVGDVCDNCSSLQNSDQTDGDKNRIGDACEDVDQDSIIGWRDNCATITNIDQKDDNNNGIGNVCEDTDRDTLFDSQDNCPTIPNLDQKDTDSDGIGNACDSEDNRMLESNRTLFIIIFSLVALVFIGLTGFFLRKIIR